MPRITDARPTALSSLKGVSADEVKAFKKAGITNNEQLLAKAKTSSEVSKLAKTIGLTPTRVKEAVNRADLVRLDGMGPATANLFENAGVNSLKELATRNPVALHQTLAEYAAKNPALHVREPSAAAVRELVSKAAQVVAGSGGVADFAAAQTFATDQMRAYVEDVLFGTDPAGADFRRAVLDRPASEWPGVKAQMLGDIANFFASAEKTDLPDQFQFVGRWLGLYTEIGVKKTGGMDRIYVEID